MEKKIDELLQVNGYEYIDCYQTGVKDEIMNGAGFLLKDDERTMIPNYFEPYVGKNVDIYYFCTDGDITLFKGDGDQDRPNYTK
ncbi:MAG: hypothetical protein ACLRZZ_08080 [Enterocloster sp.]